MTVRDSADWEALQVAALKHNIAARLKQVCEQMPEESFDALVERMAQVQWKYEQQRNRELFRETLWPPPEIRPSP